MNLDIETAQVADIPAMLTLWRATPGVGVGPGDEESSLAAFLQRNPRTCLLMRSGLDIVATVLGGFDGRRGYIYHLVVHPDWRRQGLASRILQAVVTRLEDLPADKIHLFVFEDNHGARTFYDKQGWTNRKDIAVYSWNTAKTKVKEQ